MKHSDQSDFSAIPAWNRKRRLKMTLWLSAFIGLCSLSIGAGIFQIKAGKDIKYQAVNKNTILNLLAKDSEFIKTVNKQAKLRTCRNEKYHFELVHDVTLKPTEAAGDTACMNFTGTHPTGQQIKINVAIDERTREKAVLEEVKRFSYVETELLTSDYRSVSRIKGVINGTPTTYYIAEFKPGSLILSYSPTSPTLDVKVDDMALSFIPVD